MLPADARKLMSSRQMKPRQSGTDEAMTDGGEDWLQDYHNYWSKELPR